MLDLWYNVQFNIIKVLEKDLELVDLNRALHSFIGQLESLFFLNVNKLDCPIKKTESQSLKTRHVETPHPYPYSTCHWYLHMYAFP